MGKIRQNPISYSLEEVPIDSVRVWDEAQSRGLDTESIDSLAESIRQEGLQNPPMVQKDKDGTYLLMAGQRRLEALRRLGSKTIPVLILSKNSSCSIEDAKAVSIIENIHRNEMSSSEMAASCQFLADRLGQAEAARAIGIRRSTLREYLGFDGVPERIKAMVPESVSKRNAVRICKTARTEARAVEIIERIARYDPKKKQRYIEALERLGSDAAHSDILSLANSFRARQNIPVRLSKGQAKGLARLAGEYGMEPADMAQKIVADWLSRRGF